MIKFIIVGALLLAFFWLISRPGRRRRASADHQRRKAHNSWHIRYAGFETSQDEHGGRRVHAKQRAGRDACSDQCPHCAAGGGYQASLRVFDDRGVRGRRDRRAMREDRDGRE